MGRGDRKTKKGKIWAGTSGKFRMKKKKKNKQAARKRPDNA